MKNLTDKEIYLVAVATIDKKKPEVIALINKYGVELSTNAEDRTIDSAFLTLAKTSNNFRKEFSDLSAQASVSFTGEEAFFQAVGGVDPLGGVDAYLKKDRFGGVDANLKTDSTSKSSFFSKVGEYFSPDVFKSILNTGLNVWSVKQTGQNAPTAQGAMDTAREQYYQEQGTKKSEKSGMGIGSIILLSVGGLLLLGGIIYLVRKK